MSSTLLRAIVGLLVFSALFASACATTTVQAAESARAPMGRLGHPIGTYLRLQGVRAQHMKGSERVLMVQKVNGKELSSPTPIVLEDLMLPADTQCELSGYECARWIGLPPEVREAENLPERQALWQQQLYFIVTSIQAPESLKGKLSYGQSPQAPRS